MYYHGDSARGLTEGALIRAYRNGEVNMDAAGLVVHYGNMPYDHNKLPQAADAELQEAVAAAGGWDAVEAAALKAWAKLCVADGVVYTGSL